MYKLRLLQLLHSSGRTFIDAITLPYPSGRSLIRDALNRNLSDRAQALYVVASPVLTEACLVIISNDICVPKRDFKVVLEKSGDRYKAIGFVMPQVPTKKFAAYAMSVHDVQKIAGVDFFAELPDDIENKVEASSDQALMLN